MRSLIMASWVLLGPVETCENDRHLSCETGASLPLIVDAALSSF